MEGTGIRWLVTLCLLSAAQCIPSRVTSHPETDSEDSRRVLGSSVVTSVSVIMDHGNGTKTYFTDGQSKNVHKQTDTVIGSPGNLLSPDRYEFYTFDETGDLVKRLMTLEEIHGLIAGTDPETVMADASPTYYHDALSSHSSEALMHLPASDLESLDAPAVHKVLESVQNVLKNEMAANSGKPAPPMPSGSLHRPDSASAWSALFPGLIETPDDVAHLSGYLLPSKTTESVEKPVTKKPLAASTKIPLTSSSTDYKLQPSSSSTKSQFSTTTEKFRSTPKYTTVKPESSTKYTTMPSQFTTTLKPLTTKKPFRPVQSFEKQKPSTLQKPSSISHSTARPAVAAQDGIDINKEMSASISDMLSQVTDSQSSNHKPLQTNTLIEKDNTADYVPEESSPELSYYSPMEMSLSTADGALKPFTEALTSAKRPPVTEAFTSAKRPSVTEAFASAKRPSVTEAFTSSKRPSVTEAFTSAKKPLVTEILTSVKKPPIMAMFKTSTTELPSSQKLTSTIITTRFGPTKSNATKLRPSTNGTNITTSFTTKPSSTYNKYNSTTPASIRNNYHYPPSNMSTKYNQKITQTTQSYPNKLVEPFVKVVNKTVNNATLSVKQPAVDTFWNMTEEMKNKFVKEPPPTNTVFPSNKVTSMRPLGINRTNITLSNRVQEQKTTAMPYFGSSSSISTTTVRSQTVETVASTESDKFVSVKVEEWPMAGQHPTLFNPSTVPYVSSTEKSFFSGQPLNAITDANAIRDLISSLMTKPTTVPTTTTSTTTTTTTAGYPSTTVSAAVQTLTAAVSTTSPTVVRTATPIVSSTIEAPAPTTSSTTSITSTTSTVESTVTPTTMVETATSTMASTTGSAMLKSTIETTAETAAAAATTVVATTPTTTSTITSSAVTGTAAKIVMMSTTTPESETQYVPVTHFLPELQVKDKPESTENSRPNSASTTTVIDSVLKDGISAVANMLQNTQKPPILHENYHTDISSDRPYEKVVVLGEGKQSSTEQARKQATVKSDFKEATTITTTPTTSTTTTTTITTKVSENAAMTQKPYEFTTAVEPTTRYPEPSNNDAIAMESVTSRHETEEVLRTSGPGLEMLTVFNVSSTGGPVQVAKLADLSAETQTFSDVTTPFEGSRVTTTYPATTTSEELVVTTSPTSTTVTGSTVSSTTTTTSPPATTPIASTTLAQMIADIQNAATPVADTTGPPNSTAPVSGRPSPSSNAYRPLSNGASPSTVELHPAPHESMGLEASVAFLGDDVRRFADLCNELSFKMWTAVTGKGQIASRSLVLSPFELTAMLAMVFLGARGSTSGQMNDVLRLDDMVTFNPHQVLRNITHSITNANNQGVATASFVREIYSNKGNGKILEFYKERVQQYYDGHVEEVDFNTIGDVLRRRTNLLVKRQTLGRVAEYLRGSGLSLTPPFAAFSANVFQTSCDTASTDGRDGEMYFVVRPSTRQRRLVPVPAAVWRGGFLAGYEPGLDATAVCLSPDSAVSTILVLPGQQGQVAPGDGLARLEQRLIETSYRRGGWSRILRSLLPRPGLELQVPRFSHRSVLNTTAALQKMGLKDVFSDQKADLRGVNGLYDLYLSDMLQVNTFSTCGEDVIGARHHVETYPASPQRMGRVEMLADRRRRKRYAADGVGFTDDLPLHSPYSHLPLNLRPRQARLPDVPRLRFDRPFLYLVRHNPTGMIVYLGRFNPRLLP